MPEPFRILFTPEAASMLQGIPDRRVREVIGRRIERLAHDPDEQGKPLVEDLAGLRSLAVSRHRVLFEVEGHDVIVVAVGIRKAGDQKDIYARAQKLLRLRLLDLPPEPPKRPPRRK